MTEKRLAIVTGAGRGIGNAIASKLAEDGCDIAILDVLPEEAVREHLDPIRAKGANVLYFQGSITNAADRDEFAGRVLAEFGRIDILVNNAGVAPKVRTDMLEMTEESFDFVLDINLKGTFFMTQMVANLMKNSIVGNEPEKMPVIVNIASVSSYTSSTARAEYCISKAGISMLTTLFADRLAEEGIRVYEVRPGIIFTDMTKPVKEKYDKLISEGITPVKRWGYPEDIADAVSLLCAGRLSFSTGDILNVDGGFHIRRL
jgi:NAD(P)-dependent dehydrogenase (short-subunit alcohol dehydrogenase family)